MRVRARVYWRRGGVITRCVKILLFNASAMFVYNVLPGSGSDLYGHMFSTRNCTIFMSEHSLCIGRDLDNFLTGVSPKKLDWI